MQKDSNYQKIYNTVLSIPQGKVASYGQIADLAGLPGRARLVGRALGFCPKEMNLAWYRVLRADGKIAFPLGSEQALKQKELLQAEGVPVISSRVKMVEHQWRPDLAELLIKLQY